MNEGGADTLVPFSSGGVEVTALTITSQPTKTSYVQYDKVDLTGITVIATLTGEVTADVTSVIDVSDELLEIVGTNEIIVSWGGVETSFNVSVEECTGISVYKAPDKIYYEPDDELDLSGLVIRGTSATMTADLTNSCIFNPPDGTVLSEEGTVTVTATVGVFTTSFNVSVTSAETLYQQVKARTGAIPEALWLQFVRAGCIAMVISKGEQTSFLGKQVTLSNDQSTYTTWRIEDFNHTNSGNTCDLSKNRLLPMRVFSDYETKYYFSSGVKSYLDGTFLPGFSSDVLACLKNFTQESVNSKIRIPTAYEINGRQESNQSKQNWEQQYPSFSTYRTPEGSHSVYDPYDYWTMSYYTQSYNFIFYWDNSYSKNQYTGYNTMCSVLPIIRFGL